MDFFVLSEHVSSGVISESWLRKLVARSGCDPIGGSPTKQTFYSEGLRKTQKTSLHVTHVPDKIWTGYPQTQVRSFNMWINISSDLDLYLKCWWLWSGSLPSFLAAVFLVSSQFGHIDTKNVPQIGHYRLFSIAQIYVSWLFFPSHVVIKESEFDNSRQQRFVILTSLFLFKQYFQEVEKGRNCWKKRHRQRTHEFCLFGHNKRFFVYVFFSVLLPSVLLKYVVHHPILWHACLCKIAEEFRQIFSSVLILAALATYPSRREPLSISPLGQEAECLSNSAR